MGGISLLDDVVALYALLVLVAFQYAALGFLVSSYSNSIDASIRATYGLVLGLTVVTLGPHLVLQGRESLFTSTAAWIRCFSPLTPVMEILGHGDLTSQGFIGASGTPLKYAILAIAMIVICALWTISRLNLKIFDRSRSAGIITDELSQKEQLSRRVHWLIDPQRRKAGIGPLSNPVMVKEFSLSPIWPGPLAVSDPEHQYRDFHELGYRGDAIGNGLGPGKPLAVTWSCGRLP